MRSQRTIEATVNQVGNHFGICLGAKQIAFGYEMRFDHSVILDHTVVDHGNRKIAVLAAEMGMRIAVSRGAMRGPACVANTDRALRQTGLHKRCQLPQPTGCLANRNRPLLVQDSQTGGIVTPILKPSEPLEDAIARLLKTDVADNAAHGETFFCGVRLRWLLK